MNKSKNLLELLNILNMILKIFKISKMIQIKIFQKGKLNSKILHRSKNLLNISKDFLRKQRSYSYNRKKGARPKRILRLSQK